MNSSITYNVWCNGVLRRAYIYAPVRSKRKLGETEFLARVDIGGISVYGSVRQDNDGKLYFIPSENCKNKDLISM